MIYHIDGLKLIWCLFIFSEYTQLKRNNKWTYNQVINCYIEFTSVNRYQLPKSFRLDKILRKECALPKLNLKLSEIEKEANDKNIIPKNLVLVDKDNK